MKADSQVSWLREFLFPALFVLIGAVLGTVFTYFESKFSEDREAKRIRQSFLRAIGMELDAHSDQLDATFNEVDGAIGRVTHGKVGPQFAWALRISVYTSQVGKLRAVDDSLMLEVVHFYSDLGSLQKILEGANGLSAEFTRASVPSGQKDEIRPQLLSTLRVLNEQISGFGNRLRKLRAKLPPAEPQK